MIVPGDSHVHFLVSDWGLPRPDPRHNQTSPRTDSPHVRFQGLGDIVGWKIRILFFIHRRRVPDALQHEHGPVNLDLGELRGVHVQHSKRIARIIVPKFKYSIHRVIHVHGNGACAVSTKRYRPRSHCDIYQHGEDGYTRIAAWSIDKYKKVFIHHTRHRRASPSIQRRPCIIERPSAQSSDPRMGPTKNFYSFDQKF